LKKSLYNLLPKKLLMVAVQTDAGKPSPKMILIVVLLVAVFASAVLDVVVPISAIDIGKTFHVSPGTVGQLDSLNALATVATALLMGAFAVWFRYKTLVVAGAAFIAFCALGLFLAPSFLLAQLVFPLNGIGSVMIIITAQTFVGNSYPLNKKAKAIGWIAAAGTLANAVGAPITGFMTGIVGWRYVFALFMLPTAVISLLFVLFVFPLNLPEPQEILKKEPFMMGFKQVLSQKTAVACLVAAFLINGAAFGSLFFQVTFLRQVFSVPANLASLIGTLAGTALITVGAVIGGNFVNRFGRKNLTVIATSLAATLTMLSFLVASLPLSVTLRWVATLFGGISVSAFANLTIEQVPKFRSTNMSLFSAMGGAGTAVGITAAGLVLNFFSNPTEGFRALGLTMAAFALGAILAIFLVAKDPIREKQMVAQN
jgi:predicted MFS family arabinose efflux permease